MMATPNTEKYRRPIPHGRDFSKKILGLTDHENAQLTAESDRYQRGEANKYLTRRLELKSRAMQRLSGDFKEEKIIQRQAEEAIFEHDPEKN